MPVDLNDGKDSDSGEAVIENGLEVVRAQLGDIVISLDALSQHLAAAYVQMAIDALEAPCDHRLI